MLVQKARHKFTILLTVILSTQSVYAGSTSGLPAEPYQKTSPELAELGEKLFFDKRLSVDGSTSCSTCHMPEHAFAQDISRPIGIANTVLRRNAPSLLNIVYLRSLFHDGRESSLQAQAWMPILSVEEMGNASVEVVLARLEGLDDYNEPFETLTHGISEQSVGDALASYQATLIATGSRFDDWYFDGKSSLSSDERSGFEIFQRHGCASCHSISRDRKKGALFTDQLFHNTAMGDRTINSSPDSSDTPSKPDTGRFEVTGDPNDRWNFRTPSLRNVALTAPYLHDGSLASLEDVIGLYMAGSSEPGIDPALAPFNLNRTELDQLIAFLNSLTSPDIQH